MREATEVTGHCVRQLYLDAGVTDLHLETGEAALLDVLQARWRDMAERKMYLTGGLGAHHTDEAFGDPYELPPDRCYGETCAAIASLMWSWRMLLLPARRASPTSSSARSTTASSPASRSTAAATPTSTRCTSATSTAAPCASRGSRARAARRT